MWSAVFEEENNGVIKKFKEVSINHCKLVDLPNIKGRWLASPTQREIDELGGPPDFVYFSVEDGVLHIIARREIERD